MDDKALLECAARAAGVALTWDILRRVCWLTTSIKNTAPIEWNPLDDDGDALRLAVKLKMDVTVGQSVKVVCATNDYGASRVVLPLGDDPCAATRRSIVTAAAEIGKKVGAPLVRADLEG